MAFRILVVEDDAIIRKKEVGLLGGAGYQIVEAENGVKAVEKLGEQRPYNLIHLDVNIGKGPQGYQLALGIRGGKYGDEKRNMPILFVSDRIAGPLVEAVRGRSLPKAELERGSQRYLDLVKEMIGEGELVASAVED